MNEVNFMDVTLPDRVLGGLSGSADTITGPRVAELVYAAGLGPVGFGLVGSTPTPGTNSGHVYWQVHA